jgi:hypothetical protein
MVDFREGGGGTMYPPWHGMSQEDQEQERGDDRGITNSINKLLFAEHILTN